MREDSIKEHVKTKLDAQAYPREIEFMQEMPRTKSGKILRSELRKLHRGKKAKDGECFFKIAY